MPVSLATAETYACTAVLAAVMPVVAVRGHARLVLLALGRARWELLCSVAGFVLLPACAAYGISVGGAIGAAGGLVAAETTGAAIAVLCMTKAVRRRAAGSPAASHEVQI
jgi:O-antigen/teichoic acid export membrane protein